MKKVIFYFILFGISSSIQSQSGWVDLPNAPEITNSSRYDDIFFLDEQLGWAARGNPGTVVKTEDGGESWVEQLKLNGNYFRNVEFLNANIGFLGTLNDAFYKTIDGGATWNLASISPMPPAICGLDAVGSSTIYGCGAYFSPAYVIKSTDSGVTWTTIDMSSYAKALVEIKFIDENIGFVAGQSNTGAIILKTIDGGVNWIEIYNSGDPSEYVWKIQLLENNTHIYGTIESATQGKLLKSSDSGITWLTENFQDNDVQALGFTSPSHGWMGGHGSGFFETSDGGATWSNMNLGAALNRIFFVNPTIAYCAGRSIYKFDANTLGFSNDSYQVEESIDIKIAPNPIVNKLNIQISYSHTDHLILGLYSNTGVLLENLTLDHIDNKATRQYSFDFNYPAGTYILDFHTNNGRRTKKIIKK